MAMATPTDKLKTQPAVLKLSLGARTHRVSVDLAALTFDALVMHVKAALADALPAQWSLEYTDDEGDRVTLSHARELDEALSVLLDVRHSTGGGNAIAFRVVPRAVPLSHRIVPLLRKVGELSASVARVASERSIQLRNSDVVSRGRASLTSSATRTGSLLRSAGRGVASGLHHAHSAVSTRIERRRSRSSSSSSSSPSFSESGDKHGDAAFSPTTSADVETVDLRASTSSSEPDVVTEASAEHAQHQEGVDEEEPPALIPVESLEANQDETAEELAEEVAYESDADTLATTSCDEEDREWDLVAAPAASGVNSAMPLIAEDS